MWRPYVQGGGGGGGLIKLFVQYLYNQNVCRRVPWTRVVLYNNYRHWDSLGIYIASGKSISVSSPWFNIMSTGYLVMQGAGYQQIYNMGIFIPGCSVFITNRIRHARRSLCIKNLQIHMATFEYEGVCPVKGIYCKDKASLSATITFAILVRRQFYIKSMPWMTNCVWHLRQLPWPCCGFG